MKVKDWWTYQERKGPMPWALHIRATEIGRAVHADVEVYAEWIPNKSNKMLFKDVPLTRNAKGLIAKLQNFWHDCNQNLTDDDIIQICTDIQMIIDFFK